VLSVANRIEDPTQRSGPVIAALSQAKRKERICALLRILGGLADESALEAIGGRVNDRNQSVQLAAVRELANWPSAAAMPTLKQIWQNSDAEKVQRVLALRGYLRLLGQPSDRPVQDSLALFQEVQKLTVGPEEKRLFLSSLSKLSDPRALQLAVGYLDDTSVVEEAALATVTIGGTLIQSGPQTDRRSALQKAMAATQNAELRQKAQELLEQIKSD
jgi:hypothetical protein